MLYIQKKDGRPLTPEEEFLNLLRQGRPNKALRLLEETQVSDTVFNTPDIPELVRGAINLAVRLGNPEDALVFQKKFKAPEDIWNDPLIFRNLKNRLQYWEEMGHPQAQRLRELYPVLCGTLVTPRRQFQKVRR